MRNRIHQRRAVALCHALHFMYNYTCTLFSVKKRKCSNYRTEAQQASCTEAMPPVRKKLPLLDGIDQYSAYYSVICVFGSVVGCVVVPLITQVGPDIHPYIHTYSPLQG